MTDWADVALFGAASTGIGIFLMSAGLSLWRRFYPPPPTWTVTDADGVPVISATVSATGVARLIADLKADRFS